MNKPGTRPKQYYRKIIGFSYQPSNFLRSPRPTGNACDDADYGFSTMVKRWMKSVFSGLYGGPSGLKIS